MIPARFAYLNDAPAPAWLKSALKEIAAGVHEVEGRGSNPRILQYRQMAHIPLAGDDSDVPWCAIAVNAMLESNGVAGTRSGMARSFLSDSHFESLTAPFLGAICVMASPSRGGAAGHVGMYVGEDGLFYYMAGGNQADAYSIAAFQKKAFLGFRWPKGQSHPPAPWNAAYRLPLPPRTPKTVSDK